MHLRDLPDLTDGHGHPIRKECREVRDAGEGEVPAGIPGGPNSGVEIEQPLI